LIPGAPHKCRSVAISCFRGGRCDGSRTCSFRRLTLEVRRGRRQDARPGPVKMYSVPPARARWLAVGPRLDRRVRAHLLAYLHEDSILTSLTRPVLPLLMLTADLPQANCLATSPTNSVFALPSTGADLSDADQLPSSALSRELVRALGLTRT